MTPHNTSASDSAPSEVPEGGGAPDIEITDEMISLGEDVLLCALGGSVDSFWTPSDLAVSVYRAMAAARRT